MTNEMRLELRAAYANIDALRADNERLQADLATYVNNTETTENRIIDAEFAAQELRSKNARLQAENERLQSRLAEVTAQLVDARTELRNNTPPRPGAKP